MEDTDRGLSTVGGAVLVLAVAGLILGVFIFGTSMLGESGQGETDDGTTPSPTLDSNSASQTPKSSTSHRTTSIATTTRTEEPVDDISTLETNFAERIEARNSQVTVVDIETVENTVYVTAKGPHEGGWAQATNEDFGEAFADALNVDWSNQSVSYGIDHAVVSLYDQDGDHYWNARIEESWAYRYHIGDISLDKMTSYILRSGHSETESWISREDFIDNISSIDEVDVISLEQYASTYFLSMNSAVIRGEDYRDMIVKISEAFRSARQGDKIVYLQYVIFEANGSQITTNQFHTSWGDYWEENELSLQEYKFGITNNSYIANNIPGGIGTMLTRRTPFPANPPAE